MLNLHKIWIEQCEATRGIKDHFGTERAMSYLVGEKFLQYLDTAETDAEFRAELSAFVAAAQVPYFVWVSMATAIQLWITWMNW